jgi:CheY-like chemotaxis protein
VLVVDDDPDTRRAFAAVMTALGARVATAGDGRRALQKVDGFAPDLVLLDLLMPHVDGFAVMRHLANHPRRPQMRVVAVTGLGSQIDLRKTWEAGFDAHLPKPIDVQTLKETVIGLIRQDRLPVGWRRAGSRLAGGPSLRPPPAS